MTHLGYNGRGVTGKNEQFPNTRIATPLLLAQRIMDLFDASEATPQEQDTALDIAKTLVLDRLYRPTEDGA